MSARTFSIPLTIGASEGWARWERPLQTYAVALRLFDPEPGGVAAAADRGAPVARFGTRRGEFLTPDALVHTLSGRGLVVGPAARAAIDTLACSVEETEGSARLVGVTDRVGTRRLFCLPPDDGAVELLPQFAHPDHRFHWGERSPAVYETAVVAVRTALGPLTPTELDTAALALMVELLADVDEGFELELPRLCAWFLADDDLSATSGPIEERTLRRLLGSGAPIRSPSVSSAAATPAGAGWSGLDRHVEIVESITDL